MTEVYGKSDNTWGVPVVTKADYEKIAQTVDTVQIVTALPSDASQHPKTLYIILED